jgi:hypothetical protein
MASKQAAIDLWASDAVRRIELTGDWWVEIKEELDHGEEQALQGTILKGMTKEQILKAAGQDDDTVLPPEVAAWQLMMIALYLVDWNFKDRAGRPVALPAGPNDRIKLIKSLKPAWGTRLFQEITRLREEKDQEYAAVASLPNTPSSGTASPNGATQPIEATP